MQSPLIESPGPDIDSIDLLISQALEAKRQAERNKALYDSLRDQICAFLRNNGEKDIQGSAGKARLKETKSGWVFSEETNVLSERLKNQQDIEKRMGIAKPSKTTISADVFPL
jgi:hypothetical protein